MRAHAHLQVRTAPELCYADKMVAALIATSHERPKLILSSQLAQHPFSAYRQKWRGRYLNIQKKRLFFFLFVGVFGQ